MRILGLNAFHADAAACLLVDGRLVAAVAEERLGGRTRHAAGFPGQAIARVLAMGGIAAGDLDGVAIGYDPSANRMAKLRLLCQRPLGALHRIRRHLGKRSAGRSLPELIATACGQNLAPGCAIWHVEHHLAHVASAFFTSDADEAAAFSVDGAGDTVSALYARCRGTRIEAFRRIHLPHSIGFFYTAVCQYMGFDRFGEEYKVMGLGAYGEPVHLPLMREMLRGDGQGGFRLARSFFRDPPGGEFFAIDPASGELTIPLLYGDALVERLGAPRLRTAELGQREKDLARSCQEHFEEVVLGCLRWLHRQSPGRDLVMAGGCALNGVANARILRDGPFARLHLHGASADDGTAVGAALYAHHHILGLPRTTARPACYLGPAYGQDAIDEALRAQHLPHRHLDEAELLGATARLLADGRVVGWYQGASEWGPRALGNRSILAHPGWPGMKDLINRKIKRRESFRPFAPSILAEAVPTYFEQAVESPYMMHVVRIRPERRSELAAVCHEDGTGRLHTVTPEQNPLYHRLIRAFSGLTGTPVVLNTSFNENEPIVDTPAQAIACFLRTDIDALAIGSCLLRKEDVLPPCASS